MSAGGSETHSGMGSPLVLDGVPPEPWDTVAQEKKTETAAATARIESE